MTGERLEPGVVHTDASGAAVPAHARTGDVPRCVLGPREQQILDGMQWPLRRGEWLAGRSVVKALLRNVHGLDPSRVEILPQEAGAPQVYVDGERRADIFVSLSHTRRYAVAAVACHAVGVDVSDDDDGPRLPDIARHVFSAGEAEACRAHESAQTQAAVWAIKEAVLKLHIGGVFDPGAKSVRVESLTPARIADPRVAVALFRVPSAMVALARDRVG